MGLPEIVAVTMEKNLRSQAVMRRIGMTTDPAEDFDDLDVEEGPLRLARGVPEAAGPGKLTDLVVPVRWRAGPGRLVSGRARAAAWCVSGARAGRTGCCAR